MMDDRGFTEETFTFKNMNDEIQCKMDGVGSLLFGAEGLNITVSDSVDYEVYIACFVM